MRLRLALDMNSIADEDVRKAATQLVELQSALAELGADQPDQKSAELQALLSKLQTSQQQLTSLVQQLTVQQTTAVNSVIGYQAAIQRSASAPRYKDAFIRPLIEFVNNLNKTYEVLTSGRSRASSVARKLTAELGLESKDDLASVKQQVQETSGRAQQLSGLVKRNDELIKQLTDVMTALGVNDLVAPPQAPTGVVVPAPVPQPQVAPPEPQREPTQV